jgi:hypothetical protein
MTKRQLGVYRDKVDASKKAEVHGAEAGSRCREIPVDRCYHVCTYSDGCNVYVGLR